MIYVNKLVENFSKKVLTANVNSDSIKVVQGKETQMADNFKKTSRTDWLMDDPDLWGVGHPKQRNAYRKKNRRRTRAILKRNLRNELANCL